ncbi:penicillin-binding transpeptidase domain-containing protein [Intrasporangium sp.]|uniref:penicillin-binding transpeptidase domain-containing protein n=1 Tax=Intrasporangium sp. TaxID=1925024 RepID=UPI00293AAA82|nr:penicillin-binding transpeptidase domain-containing protein [Intrasporangium sp.]MDV3220994.1 penicillin-binding protein [Intrasporangium sp.]
MRRGPSTTRTIAAALGLVLATSLTAGCSLFESDPDPADAARALAAGLAKGSLAGVALAGTTADKATTFVADAYEDMGELRPSVTVQDVVTAEEGTTATATLHTTWDVSESAEDWTYDTEIDLRLVEDAWQVAWSPSLVAPELAADETLDLARKWPRRADIVDRQGRKLMTEREVAYVGIDKTKVSGDAAARSARELAEVVGVDGKNFADRVAAAGPKAFVDAITLRVSDPALTDNIDRIDAIEGALRVPAMQVLGPSRTWAAPILGRVADATAEQIEKSEGALEPGDTVGQNGLQLRYDERLRGRAGLAVHAVKHGADGSVLDKRELFAEPSEEAEPLTVTLDEDAQTAAEEALADQTKHPTALVVVKVSTGEVLAAAVGPGTEGAPLALAGKEAPGSTFKIASTLALVRGGATAQTEVPCTDTLTVNGRVFGNYSKYPSSELGDITLEKALAHSCNTAFISQHEKVSQDDLIRAAESLGMGEDLELPFTGFLGSVPPTDDVVEHAASFIGQGRVEASPLTMAVVVASVMKGETVRPRLVDTDESLPAPATPLQADEAEVLRTAMRAVVTEGSGKVLQSVGVEYAKTGTAEFGTTNPPKTHAWMVAGRGDLAIAAYNEEGPSGTTHAAPFIIDFLEAYAGD